jgi:hypothetical protein
MVDDRAYCTDCDSYDCLHAQLFKARAEAAKLQEGLRTIGGWALASGNMETYRKVKSLLPADFASDASPDAHG